MSENIQQSPLQYRFAEFLVDVGARTLFHGSERLPITARVFDTLVLLLERAGAVVEREEFFRRVWQETAVEDGNLSQAIFVLRKLLTDVDQRIIVTLPGRGYMFTAPVETIPTPAKQESSTATASASIANPSAWRFRNLPLIPAVVLSVVLLALATVFVAMRFSAMLSPPQKMQTVRFRVPIPETLHLSRSGGSRSRPMAQLWLISQPAPMEFFVSGSSP